MDMGIVNAGQLAIYEDIEAKLKEGVEDVLLNRRADGTDRLLEIAEQYRGQKGAQQEVDLSWRKVMSCAADACAGQWFGRLH